MTTDSIDQRPPASVATAHPSGAGPNDASPFAAFAARLALERRARSSPLPDPAAVELWADEVVRLLFGRAFDGRSRSEESAGELASELGAAAEDLAGILAGVAGGLPAPIGLTVERFMFGLPDIHERLGRDAIAIEAGDPAASSVDEVVLAYPGFLALAFHRIAHGLDALGVPLVPRILSEAAHRRTGIDIHPSATLGCPIVIDHGTEIVIGATAMLGDAVKLYQGVTLGALSVDKSLAARKRHPTIEDGVVIYANATILGGETVIGAGSVIGGNVWLTSSVPAGSVVQHRSEVRVRPLDREHEGADPAIDFVI